MTGLFSARTGEEPADTGRLGRSAGAVRQLLGHTRLPDFVGGFGKAQYRGV
jgi:hypothetical protein